MNVYALWSSCNYEREFRLIGVYAHEVDAVAEGTAIMREEEAKGYDFVLCADEVNGFTALDRCTLGRAKYSLRVKVATMWVRI